jgi:hypothetical protein
MRPARTDENPAALRMDALAKLALLRPRLLARQYCQYHSSQPSMFSRILVIIMQPFCHSVPGEKSASEAQRQTGTLSGA